MDRLFRSGLLLGALCSITANLGCAGRTTAAPPPELAAPAISSQEMEAALLFAEAQFANVLERVGKEGDALAQSYPQHASRQTGGRFVTGDSSFWMAPFFPAALWTLYSLTGSGEWRRGAETGTLGFWGEAVTNQSENLGYKILPFREGHEASGDEGFRSFLLRGAATYASKADEVACVGSFANWPGGKTVGSFMGIGGPGNPRGTLQHGVHISGVANTEVLFWAALQPDGKRRWYDLALRQALNTVRDHLRPDGSAYSVVDYHPGCPSRPPRWRGNDAYLDEGATRARSQAYAMHGFAVSYRYTHHPALLAAAKKATEFYLRSPSLPPDLVPHWQMNISPSSTEPRDSAAAAIAAAALLEAARLPDLGGSERARYRSFAERTVQSLVASYLAIDQREGLLTGAFLNAAQGSVSFLMADYYLLKAMRLLLGREGLTCRAPVCEIEAEAAGRLDQPLGRNPGPPGFVAVPAGGVAGGRAEYAFNLVTPGRFRLALVASAPSGQGSLLFNIDGEPTAAMNSALAATTDFQRRELGWTAPAAAPGPGAGTEFALGAGRHRVIIKDLQPGLQINRLLLERQSRVHESFDDNAGQLEAVTGQWKVEGGIYQLTEPVPPSTPPAPTPANLAVHGNAVSGPFELRVRGRVRTKENQRPGLALLFGYQDPKNYAFVSLGELADGTPGGIFQVKGGTPRLLAVTAQPPDSDRWYLVRVRYQGGVLEFARNGVVVARLNDLTIPTGRVGLGSSGPGAAFDDLVVE